MIKPYLIIGALWSMVWIVNQIIRNRSLDVMDIFIGITGPVFWPVYCAISFFSWLETNYSKKVWTKR